MTIQEIYDQIRERFLALPGVSDLLGEIVNIRGNRLPEITLMPEGDVPSNVNRPEYCTVAKLKDVKGEAYSETPADFYGTLKELLDLPLAGRGIDARVLAGINAAMKCLGLIENSELPDDHEIHRRYANKIFDEVTEKYGKEKIVLVGYDGYIVQRFMEEPLDFWTLDRNPDNITKDRFNHVIVNSGKVNRDSSFTWAKILIVTGSTLCNGTILPYLECENDVKFYGITFAGASRLLNLPWYEV